MRGLARHATTVPVTRASGETASTAGDSFARDWTALRADDDIQFATLPTPKVPETPEWMLAFGRFMAELFKPVGEALVALGQLIGLSGNAAAWVVGGLVAALLLYLLWQMVPRHLRRKPQEADEEAPLWVPARGEAQALLEDADRLAAEGRFDEATHLLLRRSVQQIQSVRPGLLEPSSTAREISALPALPQAARSAFGVIAQRVERSLFALRSLSAEDWHAARAAYAQFALEARA